MVKLTDFGNGDKKPEGKIIEILGHVNDPGTDILSIVRAYDLPMDPYNLTFYSPGHQPHSYMLKKLPQIMQQLPILIQYLGTYQ